MPIPLKTLMSLRHPNDFSMLKPSRCESYVMSFPQASTLACRGDVSLYHSFSPANGTYESADTAPTGDSAAAGSSFGREIPTAQGMQSYQKSREMPWEYQFWNKRHESLYLFRRETASRRGT